MSAAAKIYFRLKDVALNLERRSNLRDAYRFINRGEHSDVCVIVLAGYKEPLWPYVFDRLKAALPFGVDVCIMSAGRYDEQLDTLARVNRWSYLSTRTNDICLIQNIAVQLHPAARRFVKIDEDMFLTKETIRDCLAYQTQVKASGVVNPAFVAPMININGVCYRPLLERLGLLAEFEAKFGVARVSTLGTPLTDDADAAMWMWRKTAPLERTADLLRRDNHPLMFAPVQFSIGMIVIERAFIDETGLLPVRRHMLMMKQSTLGADEEYLCRKAVFHARPVVICPHAFAGHFSFGRQYSGMLALLAAQPGLFGTLREAA